MSDKNGSNGHTSLFDRDPIATGHIQRTLNEWTGILRNQLSERGDLFRRFTDPRRSIDDECGYPSAADMSGLTGAQRYRDLYDTNPFANRVVNLIVKEAFRKQPKVYVSKSKKKSTQFDEDFKSLNKNLKPERSWYKDDEGSLFWCYVKRWITLSRVGSFGILLLGVDDGKNLDQPVDGVSSTIVADGYKPDGSKGKVLKEAVGNKGCFPTDIRPWHKLDKQEAQAEHLFIQNRKVMVVNEWRKQLTLNPGFPKSNKVASFGGAEGTDQQYDRMYDNPFGSAATDPPPPRPSMRSAQQGFQPRINPTDPISAASPQSAQIVGAPRGQSPQARQGGVGSPNYDSNPQGGDKEYTGISFPSGDSSQSQWVGGQQGGSQYGKGREPSATKDQAAKRNLLFMRPYDESLVQVVQYEADIRNPRFGLPVMYRVTLNDPRDTHSGIGLPMATVRVHWSRVIHGADVASNPGSSDIFASPAMRRCLKRLLDLDKIFGAAGEGYWKSAFATLFLGTHPQLGPDVWIDKNKVKDELEQIMNGLQRWIIGNGLTAENLAPTMTDPSTYIDKNIEAICVAEGCPVPVFKGYEIGEQASENNDEGWNERVAEWQQGSATPLFIAPLIDRLILMGVLAEPEATDDMQGEVGIIDEDGNGVDDRLQGDDNGDERGDPGLEGSDAGDPRDRGRQAGEVQGSGRRGKGVDSKANRPRDTDLDQGDWQQDEEGNWTHNKSPSFPPKKDKARLDQSGSPPAPVQHAPLSTEVDGEADEPQDAERPDPTGEWDDAEQKGQPGAKQTGDADEGSGDTKPEEAGYVVEWPDLQALSEKDRSAVTLQVVQALVAYIQGDVESLMPTKDLFVRLLGWDEEEVEAMLQDVMDKHAMGDTMTMPPMQGGYTPSAPPGTQEHDDQEMQAQQMEAMRQGQGDGQGDFGGEDDTEDASFGGGQ